MFRVLVDGLVPHLGLYLLSVLFVCGSENGGCSEAATAGELRVVHWLQGCNSLGLGLISVCLQPWSAFVLDQGQVLVVPDFGLREGCEEAAGHLFGR